MEQAAEGECLLLQSQLPGERGAEIVLPVRIMTMTTGACVLLDVLVRSP